MSEADSRVITATHSTVKILGTYYIKNVSSLKLEAVHGEKPTINRLFAHHSVNIF